MPKPWTNRDFDAQILAGAVAFPALALENIPVVLDWLQKVVEQ